MKRGKRARRGMVLPAILFGLVVMSVLATAALRTANDEAASVRSFRESGMALFVADAGLRRTVGNWPTAVSAMSPGDSLDLGWQSLSNRGRFRAVIYKVDQGGTQSYAVVVRARGAGNFAGQRTVVAMFAGVPVFSFGGILAGGNVSLSGGSSTDSYNSLNGPYNPLTADSAGNIVANGSISLSNTATIIKGSISASGSVTNSQATVTGTSTSSAPVTQMDTLSCPSGGYTPASQVPSGPGTSYSEVTGVLSLGAVAGVPQNYILAGNSYYFSSLIIGGGSTLTFATTTHTDIYISNTLDTGGGSLVNSSANATKVSIWACGTSSSTPWRLTGGTAAFFSVFAPTHDVTVTGAGNLYGAVVSKGYTASGGSSMHYDKALAAVRTPVVSLVSGSWAELPY